MMTKSTPFSIRIPTPVFGAGLIEQIRDSDILANLAREALEKQRLQIKGKLNIVHPTLGEELVIEQFLSER